MSKNIFTKKQIEELIQNNNIERCSKRSITYTKDFKKKALKMYDEGFGSREVFRQAGFNIEILGRDQPSECIRRWKKIVKKKGFNGLTEIRGKNGKGGRSKKIKDKSEKDKIKRLEAEVAYLKAENDFLAKLRAKRMEQKSGRNRNTS